MVPRCRRLARSRRRSALYRFPPFAKNAKVGRASERRETAGVFLCRSASLRSRLRQLGTWCLNGPGRHDWTSCPDTCFIRRDGGRAALAHGFQPMGERSESAASRRTKRPIPSCRRHARSRRRSALDRFSTLREAWGTRLYREGQRKTKSKTERRLGRARKQREEWAPAPPGRLAHL